MKRRTLIAGLGAAGITAACARTHGVFDQERASLVIRGGSVYTARADGAVAESIAIGGDRLLAVGSRTTIDGYIGPSTRVIDARGGMVLPGFIDTHTHFVWGSIARTQVALGDATGPEDAEKRLAAYARTHPNEPWILGGGWVYETFPAGLPTKALIDRVIPDRPVVLDSFDGHLKWLNSKALAVAGITRSTPDIVKDGKVVGTIVRDPATGEPTGILRDVAQNLVLPLQPKPSREKLISLIHDGMRAANTRGLTSVINASGDLDEMDLYDTLRRRRQLTLRTTNAYSDLNGKPHTLSPAELDAFEEARRRYTGDWVRAGIVKFFMDGVIEGHTAALIEPYATEPKNRGEADYPSGRYNEMLIELDRRGFAVMTHAIGDGAVREALNGYEAAIKANGRRDRRWRIEHIEVCNPQDVPRFGQLGIVASMQPYHWCCHDSKGDDAWSRNLGPQRWAQGFQWRNIAQGGATLVHGSDWPVVTIDPLVGIYSAITREDLSGKPAGGWFPQQRLTLPEVLAGYTRNAASVAFMENAVGTLEPGKKADVVVLQHDLRGLRAADVLTRKSLQPCWTEKLCTVAASTLTERPKFRRGPATRALVAALRACLNGLCQVALNGIMAREDIGSGEGPFRRRRSCPRIGLSTWRNAMKVNVLFAIITVAASVLSGAAIATATPAHMSSVIGGRVVDSIDQRPLGGVEVDVFDDSFGSHASRAIATTTTNKDGSFALLGIRRGTYHLELAKRGYALEIITGLSVESDQHILIARPFGMRTAIVTTGIGQAMETQL